MGLKHQTHVTVLYNVGMERFGFYLNFFRQQIG